MVDRVTHLIEIHASAQKTYDGWHRFEDFPRYMNRVKSVTQTGDNRWHWVINTPLGRDIEWDAVIDSDERNRTVSWHTVGHPKVDAQGTVRFDEVAPNRTEMTCTVQYNVHGSPITEALAELLSNPQAMLIEEMTHFKNRIEGTDRPAAKATQGKTLAKQAAKSSKEREYLGSMDLVAEVLAEEGIEDVSEIEDPAIRDMLFEENPYLGVEGAWMEEDAWPDDSTEPKPFEPDVFKESLDVFDEDLENFTQDMDDNVDTGFVTGQAMEDYEMVQEAEQLKPSSSRASKPVQSEL